VPSYPLGPLAERTCFSQASLRCSPEAAGDPRLCHDGVHHFLLPAFFCTLTALRGQQREVSIVIRTFVTDAPAVVGAMAAFAYGRYLGAEPWPELAAALVGARWAGRYRASDGVFTLTGAAKHAAGAPDLSVFGGDRKAKQVAERAFETGPGLPGPLSALSVLHSKSFLYGAFVWARRALNSQ
jgi:hypothetical protein